MNEEELMKMKKASADLKKLAEDLPSASVNKSASVNNSNVMGDVFYQVQLANHLRVLKGDS